MQLGSGLAVAIASIVLAAILAVHPAAAFDFTLSNPAVHGNLAVYPVHGAGPGGGNLLTLDEATQQGTAAIHANDDGPLQIVNSSSRSLFVQAGTLLLGGLQDQVVSTDTIVGPHSTRALYTFCADPFRSTARSDADPNSYTSAGALFPWSAAKLSLMTGLARSAPVARTLRQSGVWWSIDTLRSTLSERLGEALEPARIPEWSRDEVRERRAHLQLAQRTSAWTTSLPLALQNERLAQAIAPYLDALQSVIAGEDVIGVVVAINGKFTSADVYGSSDLMRNMWPALARAAATEAIAAATGRFEPVPTVAAAQAFVEAALTAPAQVPPSALASFASDARFALTGLREAESTIASDTVASDGAVHRSVVAKLDPAAAARTPDTLIVQMIAADSVKLNEGEFIVLQRGAQGSWVSEVRSLQRVAAAIEPGQAPTDRILTPVAAPALMLMGHPIMREMVPLAVVTAFIVAWFGTLLALARKRRRAALRVAPVTEATMATAKPVPDLHSLRIAVRTPRPDPASATRRHIIAPPRLQAA